MTSAFLKKIFPFGKGKTSSTAAEQDSVSLKKDKDEINTQDNLNKNKEALSWNKKLQQALLRSSSQLSEKISQALNKKNLDKETLKDLEDILLQADLGIETTSEIIKALASSSWEKGITLDKINLAMASEIQKILDPVAKVFEPDLSYKPHVILITGVNGTGKTTTIGKLASKLKANGLSVMLAAGDTFRAAAIEQLKIWSERTSSPLIAPQKAGSDPAGLAYESLQKAKEEGCDVLIIDTAGRLQNKDQLMAELGKIIRTLKKLDKDAPHTTLQVLDATTGRNTLNQVEIFRNIAGVNGLIMTKLDGTARGGILVAVAQKYQIPIHFIGTGEQMNDLEPFSAADFAKNIAGIH